MRASLAVTHPSHTSARFAKASARSPTRRPAHDGSPASVHRYCRRLSGRLSRFPSRTRVLGRRLRHRARERGCVPDTRVLSFTLTLTLAPHADTHSHTLTLVLRHRGRGREGEGQPERESESQGARAELLERRREEQASESIQMDESGSSIPFSRR